MHTIDYPSSILSLDVLVNISKFNSVEIYSINKVLFKNEDKSIIVGMSDGLLSIKDRRRYDEKSENLKETPGKGTKTTKYNPYKYVSPSLVNNSPVGY